MNETGVNMSERRIEMMANFASLPPGLTRIEVRKRLKVSRWVAERWIRDLGYQAKDGRTTMWDGHKRKKLWKAGVDWTKIDWRKSDSQVSKETGVSRTWVWRSRKTWGRPHLKRPKYYRRDSDQWPPPKKVKKVLDPDTDQH